MTDYSDLIERLEKATGPDRQLDAEIMRAVCSELSDTMVTDTGWCVGGDHAAPSKAKDYTGSIDAALTLVPEGYWLDIETGTQKLAPSFEWPIVEIGEQHTGLSIWRGQAKTLALGICLAAIRARSAGGR